MNKTTAFADGGAMPAARQTSRRAALGALAGASAFAVELAAAGEAGKPSESAGPLGEGDQKALDLRRRLAAARERVDEAKSAYEQARAKMPSHLLPEPTYVAAGPLSDHLLGKVSDWPADPEVIAPEVGMIEARVDPQNLLADYQSDVNFRFAGPAAEPYAQRQKSAFYRLVRRVNRLDELLRARDEAELALGIGELEQAVDAAWAVVSELEAEVGRLACDSPVTIAIVALERRHVEKDDFLPDEMPASESFYRAILAPLAAKLPAELAREVRKVIAFGAL